MIEYIVAIDVTRLRFPADAQAPNATLVHKVNEVKRVAESVITIVKTWALWSRGGRGRGTGSLHTLYIPGAMHVVPHSGESHITVVPVTLRDPLLWVSL